ncbi:MAG TPA: cytochrome c [Sedimenticola thiotaurini]|uniref:Cytochrome c n=1 Tax=Sedimenticola thiotaurini TaxID=1543721 RepID=A0A831RP33_9GAMM|nr:cytochrome c [Sedimenticola thiotaurini]
MKFRFALIGLIPFAVAACSSGESSTSAGSEGMQSIGKTESAPARRWYAFQHVSQGARVFQENCAGCHGKQAAGAPNWKQMGSDGKYPPPPLNGTGHAWHHPLNMLFHVVKNGSPGGQGNMPAWKDKLSDDEIVAAIAWFQSKWPDEIYRAWAQRDIASRKKNSG